MGGMRLFILFLLILFLWYCLPVHGNTVTFVNSASLGNATVSWFSPDAWSTGIVPGENDTVVIDGRGSFQPIQIAIDALASTVDIERLILRNATLSILESSFLSLSNTNTSEPSVIRDAARLLLLDGAVLQMPVGCDGVGGTLHACLRDSGFLLDLFEASSIESDVQSDTYEASSSAFFGGSIRARGAGTLVSLRARTNALLQSHIVVSDRARMEILHAYDSLEEYRFTLQDSSVHIDVSATLFLGYDESLPLSGDCDAGLSATSSMQILSVVDASLEPFECDLCVDGIVELRPLPCFFGAGVLASRVVQSGVLDFRDARFRFRGYTFLHGGGVLSFSPTTTGGTARFAHTGVLMEDAAYVFVYGGSVLEWSDEVLVRGCESFTIDSTLESLEPFASSTFDSELSLAARQTLAGLAFTCTELDADSSIVPHIVTKDSQFKSLPNSGRLNLLSLASSSSHFLIDTSWHVSSVYDDRTVTLSVADHTFTEPVFFHIGSYLSSAYWNETTGSTSSLATLRFEHPESHIIISRLTVSYEANVEIDNVAFELVNCTMVLGTTYNISAVALNPPQWIYLRGSITVEGSRGRLLLGAAADSAVAASFTYKLTLSTADSFILIRDGATLGNMIRDESGEHVLPSVAAHQVAWFWDRSVAGGSAPALRIESDAELLVHGGGADGKGKFWMSMFAKLFRVVLSDMTVHLYGHAQCIFGHYLGVVRHTFTRVTVRVHGESTFVLYRSPVDLFDFSVIGDGENGANYGKFKALGDLHVRSSMVVGGVILSSRDSEYMLEENYFHLYENATVEISDYSDLLIFRFVSYGYVPVDAYETGVAPTVTFRSTDASVAHQLSGGGILNFWGQMHVYIDCIVRTVGTGATVSEAIVHVPPSGWLQLDGSGWSNYDSTNRGVLLIEGGKLSTEGFIREDISVPWIVTDGGIIQDVGIWSPYGRCTNGTLIDVTCLGLADIQGGSDTRRMSFTGASCQTFTLDPNPWSAPLFEALREEYEAWSAPCTRNGEVCCVRLSNTPAGASIDHMAQGGFVIGENVPSQLLSISDIIGDGYFLDIRAPPSDASLWVLDDDVNLDQISLGTGVRYATSNLLTVAALRSLPKRRGDNVTLDDPLPLVDLFGVVYGVQILDGVHLRLHGFFSGGPAVTPIHEGPSILEYGSDVEAPLRTMGIVGEVKLLAQPGASLRTDRTVTIHAMPEDELTDFVLDRSLLLVKSSTTITIDFRFALEVRGGHLNIDRTTLSVGLWSVLSDGTVTLNKNGKVNPIGASTTLRVSSGGRFVIAAGRTFIGNIVMESGSLLVLPGAGGVTIDGNVHLGAGATILQLYGDGNRVLDVGPVVSVARVDVTGDLVVGSNVEVTRVHVDAGLPPLVAASSLLVIGASSVNCSLELGAGVTCNSTGLMYTGETSSVACPSVPMPISRTSCVQCVSTPTTSCAYVLVEEPSKDSYTAVCMGGSSVDGPYALANGGSVNGTLLNWSATVGDCYVMSQPRCHQRNVVQCEAHGGAMAAFEYDETLGEHARCEWCSADILTGNPRCLTQFEMRDGFCADQPTPTTVATSAVSTTALSSTLASTMTSSVAPPTTVAVTFAVDTTSGTLDLMVTEPSDDSWVWAVIGALGALMVLSLLTAVVCFFFPFGKRRRRKAGKGDGGKLMTSLGGGAAASSLPHHSSPPHSVEYSPMPVLTGSSDVTYADGDLEPRGATGTVDGEYASGDMAAPRLLPSAAVYANGDMEAPRLARTDSEYNTSSDMFFTADSASTTYAQGELRRDVDGAGGEYRADILACVRGGASTVSSEYETTELQA